YVVQDRRDQRNHAQHHPELAALLEGVQAEAGDILDLVESVDLVLILQTLPALVPHELPEHGLHVLLAERRKLAGQQVARDPHERRTIHLEVQVRPAAGHELLENRVDVDHPLFSTLRMRRSPAVRPTRSTSSISWRWNSLLPDLFTSSITPSTFSWWTTGTARSDREKVLGVIEL